MRSLFARSSRVSEPWVHDTRDRDLLCRFEFVGSHAFLQIRKRTFAAGPISVHLTGVEEVGLHIGWP
ncbi:MAG: hypothetical protein NTY57_04900 [Solirubrobacterales bacterium]|nr:hypothetical protein [Solirubrobacterales bacterium]